MSTTLAESIGLTLSEARAIAQVACDAAEAGDLEGSRSVLESLVAINPLDCAVQAALGTVYQKLEMLPEAEAAYSAAVDRGDHSIARINRAELRLKRGDVRGEADLEALIKADPKLSEAPAARAKKLLDVRLAMKKSVRPAPGAPGSSTSPVGAKAAVNGVRR
jgi:predicted Zn-dependent protease